MGELAKLGMSPHQIYVYLTSGRGTDRLDAAQEATRAEWEREEERAALIRRQGELIRSGWQGAASDGAFGAAQPLAESALQGATLLSRAEDLLDRQSGSFHRAANSVEPVPPELPDMPLDDPKVLFSDYEEQVKAHQATAQHNIDVYRGYDGASEYNQTNMPSEYVTVNHTGGSVGVTAVDARGDGGDVVEVQDAPRTEAGPPSPRRESVVGPPPGGSGSLPPEQTSPGAYVPPTADAPGTLPSGVPPVPRPAPGDPGPGGIGPGLPVGGVSGGSGGDTSGPGGFGGPGSTGSPGGRGGSGRPSGALSQGPREDRPGSPGGNPRGGPSGGTSGSPGPGAGPRGRVLGAAPGPGAIAAEEAAVRRAGATALPRAAATSGPLTAAPVGAARDKGDEDTEHQRKVLIEVDPERVFGSDVLTAPPVIGVDDEDH